MTFFVDESVDRHVVTRLREHGHLVVYVCEIEASISDNEVMNRADAESAVLLTGDKDFGEMVFRQRRVTAGVVLIRLAGLSPDRKADLVAAQVDQHADRLRGNFSVISPAATSSPARALNHHEAVKCDEGVLRETKGALPLGTTRRGGRLGAVGIVRMLDAMSHL